MSIEKFKEMRKAINNFYSAINRTLQDNELRLKQALGMNDVLKNQIESLRSGGVINEIEMAYLKWYNDFISINLRNSESHGTVKELHSISLFYKTKFLVGLAEIRDIYKITNEFLSLLDSVEDYDQTKMNIVFKIYSLIHIAQCALRKEDIIMLMNIIHKVLNSDAVVDVIKRDLIAESSGKKFRYLDYNISGYITIITKNDYLSKDLLSGIAMEIISSENFLKLAFRESDFSFEETAALCLARLICDKEDFDSWFNIKKFIYFLNYTDTFDLTEKKFGNLLDYRDENGDTILYALVSKNLIWATLEVINRYKALVEIKSVEGKNLLFYVKNDIILDCLIKNGLNPNALDAEGNSALINFLYAVDELKNYEDDIQYKSVRTLSVKLVELGGSGYRKYKEEKSNLHFKVALNIYLEKTDLQDVNIDFADMERRRTALHYAIVLKNYEAAMFLINNGASVNVCDLYGNDALHYAIISGNLELIKTIAKKKEKFKQANQNNSYLVKLCYLGLSNGEYQEVKDLLEQFVIKEYTELEKTIIKIIENKTIDFDSISEFDYDEKMLILASVSRMLHDEFDRLTNYVREEIYLQQNTPITYNGTSYCYGIEIEMAEINSACYLPNKFLFSSFNIGLCTDRSVYNDFFMKNTYMEDVNDQIINNYLQDDDRKYEDVLTEITSEVCDTYEKINAYVSCARYLYKGGSRVNKSTGTHIHVNILGNNEKNVESIVKGLDIYDKNTREIELSIIKQIFANWYQLEHLLVGVVRGGDLYDSKASYSQPIKEIIDKIMESDSIDELKNAYKDETNEYAYNKNYTLNALSLLEHGTLEFRILHGTINPICLQAWVNFVHRLSVISVEQVKNRLNNDEQSSIVNYYKQSSIIDNLDLNYLYYIFMAEMQFDKTWNLEWNAPYDSSILPAKDVTWVPKNESSNITSNENKRPLQKDIQESILYRAYNLAIEGEDYKDLIDKIYNQKEREMVINDLIKMLELNQHFPSVFENKLLAPKQDPYDSTSSYSKRMRM